MKKLRIGVIGVGNCFAGLIQGIYYYKKTSNNEIGLVYKKIGNYTLSTIDFVSAFDVDKNKIGKTIDRACFEYPNLVKWTKLPKIPTIVKESPALDGIGSYIKDHIRINKQKNPDFLKRKIIKELRRTKTEILLNYLPVGSQKATEFWASIALQAGCAFVNCIPVFIASDKQWVKKFEQANLPLIGDDIKGQIGATIIHRVLTKLCADRGAKIDNSYQLNVGGNTDFLNMKEAERLIFKKISKTKSVMSQLNEENRDKDFFIGPSDYIHFLGNTKLAFINISGKLFANIPFSIDLKLEVDDKANSAGVVVDVLRLTKIAIDNKIGGYMDFSSYFMKHPLIQKDDKDAKHIVREFIAKFS